MAEPYSDEELEQPSAFLQALEERLSPANGMRLREHLARIAATLDRLRGERDLYRTGCKDALHYLREDMDTVSRAILEAVLGEPDTLESLGAGPGAPCCPKCATPQRERHSRTMLRCEGCNHLWEREPAEVAR